VQFIEDKMYSVYFVVDKLHRARPRLSHVWKNYLNIAQCLKAWTQNDQKGS